MSLLTQVFIVCLTTVSNVFALHMKLGKADYLHAESAEKITCASFGWNQSSNHRAHRVIDGYAYNGETLIVSARYEELKDYINGTALLITEANFKGDVKKPVEPPQIPMSYHTRLNATAFRECGDKDEPSFNYCVLALTKNSIATPIEHFDLDDDDWVIFSDPDEIPDREMIRLLHECDVPVGPSHENNYLRLQGGKIHRHFMYSFGCSFQTSTWADATCANSSSKPCRGPVVMRASTMRTYGLRTFQNPNVPYCVEKGPYATCGSVDKRTQMLISDSVWHLSSFGGLQQLATKMRDNSDEFSEGAHLKEVARNCVDLDKNHKSSAPDLQKLVIDFKYPQIPHSIADAPERYSVFFDWD